MSNKFENLSTEELRQVAKDTVDKLSAQGRAELLKWTKREFPELGDHNR